MSVKPKDTDGEAAGTSKMQEWRFVPGDPHMYFRCDHSDDPWRKMVLPLPNMPPVEEQSFTEDQFPCKPFF